MKEPLFPSINRESNVCKELIKTGPGLFGNASNGMGDEIGINIRDKKNYPYISKKFCFQYYPYKINLKVMMFEVYSINNSRYYLH